MQIPTPKELCEATGISSAYASMILNGEGENKRTPARSLAIHIFRKTAWRHPSIADLTDDQISMLEQIEPWSPRSAQDEAA